MLLHARPFGYNTMLGGAKMNIRGTASWAVIAIVVFALAASGVFLLSTRSNRNGFDQTSRTSMMGSGPEMNISKASTPQFMELFAQWCPPCKQMKPILDDLEKTYKDKVKFMRVDIDKNPDTAKKFKVDAIPVQLFFDKDGKLLFKHVGFYSKAEIIAQFKKMGVE